MKMLKIDMIKAIELAINQQCVEKLGVHIYCTAIYLTSNQYVLHFCKDNIVYLVRGALIDREKLYVNFPSKEEMLKAIKEKK